MTNIISVFLQSNRTRVGLRTHITLQVVCLSGLDHIAGVRQTSPVVETSSVVKIVYLDLAFLGQFKIQHVHWEMELGLGLVEILLVQHITGDLG